MIMLVAVRRVTRKKVWFRKGRGQGEGGERNIMYGKGKGGGKREEVIWERKRMEK